MNIRLSDHFTYKRLLQFVFPSIIMMIFTSIYGVVDGIFVSNYVGKTPFAAVNLIMPVFMILGAVGFMLGTGGSALVAKTLGEKDNDRANEYFSLLIYTAIIIGIIISIIGIVFMEQISCLHAAKYVSGLFAGYDSELYSLTVRGFSLYAPSFLLCGFSIFGSSFFTALNDGLVSAVISLLRIVVFQVIAVLVLPTFLGIDGIWLLISVAEFLALIVTVYLFMKLRKKYNYA